LDDMGFWTRGLSPSEILSVFVAGQAGQPLTNADAYAGQTLPLITGQPQGVNKYQGEYKAQFTVQAVGSGALSYQWLQNGGNLTLATNSILNLSGPFTNTATYAVVVTDAGNGHSITSAPALLTVQAVTSITNALTGYWNFDETSGTTAADSTPSGRTATLINFPGDMTTWVPGQIGGALNFGGSAYSQYASVAGFVHATNNTLTLSAWVWANGADDRASIVDGYGQNPIGQFRFGLGSASTRPLTGGVISQAAGYVAATETTGFPLGSWQHVALVADGAMLRLYRNGIQVATNAYNGTIVSPSALTNLFLGVRIADDGLSLNTVPGYWNGKMDDLGLWGRGLSPAEILTIYVAGRVGQPLNAADAYAVTLPHIVQQPQAVTKYAGEYGASASVVAAGNGALSYQWYFGSQSLPGATNAVLSLTNQLTSAYAGGYNVVVTDAGNGLSVTSSPAMLTLLTVTDVTNGLIGHWTFDETNGTTAADSTANARAATLNNYYDNSMWVTGQVGGAMSFGVSGYGQYATITNFVQPTNGTLTLSAWVWADAATGWEAILDNYGQTGIGQFRFGLGGSSPYPLAGTVKPQAAAGVSAAEGTGLPTGSWQHVALVADGVTLRLYRNGTQVGASIYGGTLQNPSPILNLFIGALLADDGISLNTTPAYWTGKMDDLGIWARGLTPAEITAIYAAGNAGKDISRAQQYIITPPIISGPPGDSTVTEGEDATLTVTATGTAPLSYQWEKGGVAIAGATNGSLTLISAVLSDDASYVVIVTNIAGSVTSAPAAHLTVNALALPVVITNGLGGYWRFDETSGLIASDSSGLGNNATLNNFVGDDSQWVPGVTGGALEFLGSEYALAPGYPRPTTTMSVAAWVRAGAFPSYGTILKNWGSSAGQFHFGLSQNTGALDLYIATAASAVVHVSDPTPLPTNVWVHAAFVCDGTNVVLYRNGARVASAFYDGTLNAAPINGALGIGAKLNDAGTGVNTTAPGYWQGDLDDIGFWTRGLAAAEVQALYTSGLEGIGLGSASLSPMMRAQHSGTNLVFSWPEIPLGRGFVLESTASLSPPSWGPAGGTLTVANGQCSVSVPVGSGGHTFFRLRQ
jgi:hypothetical protein